VDSHQEFMDVSDALPISAGSAFYSPAPKMFDDAVLVSHAVVRQWDNDNLVTLSPAGIGRLRKHFEEFGFGADEIVALKQGKVV
jgi:beta-N-acetylhexosaminidase